MRLKGHRCFSYLHKKGNKFHTHNLSLKAVKANAKLQKHSSFNQHSLKIAISISHKVSKKAVVRNKLRRQLHQHITNRLGKMKSENNIWVLVSLKPPCTKQPITCLLNECDKLFSKSGLIHD